MPQDMRKKMDEIKAKQKDLERSVKMTPKVKSSDRKPMKPVSAKKPSWVSRLKKKVKRYLQGDKKNTVRTKQTESALKKAGVSEKTRKRLKDK